MGRWASFSSAGLCWETLRFDGKLSRWHWWTLGTWSVVIKTINGIYDLNDTQREGNCCVIVSSSIFCDACRRFVFPPVVRAPMNLNLDCPAGCTHTHTHKKKKTYSAQNYCHCKFDILCMWLIFSSIFLSVCYFSPYNRFACAVEWLILAKLLGYTWLFPGCLA